MGCRGEYVATIEPVVLNKTYKAPQNDQVTVTFTKLPEKAGNLVIKEIELSAEEQASLGALSDTAYDISSNMTDGTFAYDLTLPYPKKMDNKIVDASSVQVLYTEKADVQKDDMQNVADDKNVDRKTDDSKNVIELKGLDHFTIFVVGWNFPNDPDNAVADGGIAMNEAKTISVVSANIADFSQDGATTNSMHATGWNDGHGAKYWQVEFSSIGYYSLSLSSKQRSSSTGPRDFKVQYKIGSGGEWTNVSDGVVPAIADNWISGVVNNIALPNDCNNQSSVYLRWVMASNVSVGSGTVSSSGASNIDDIVVSATAGNITNVNSGQTYTTIQAAIDAATAGDTINLAAGTYELTAQVNVTKPVSIVGQGVVTLKAISNFGSTNGSKHLLASYAGTSGSPVTISNVTLDVNNNSYGMNTYGNAYVVLNNVIIKNSKGAGLTVNGSIVDATDLNTSGNAWGAVNVDPGSGVTTASVFTLHGGTLAENNQIWSDGGSVDGSATVTVNATGYEMYAIGGTTGTQWTNRALTNAATITKNSVTTLYSTIQAAINAASDGDTINVADGTYKEQLNVARGVTIIGNTENPDDVIIDGENKTTLANDGQIRIYNPAGDVTFKGFKIINTGIKSGGDIYLGILTKSSSQITIQNCKLIGHGSSLDPGWDYGIWAYGSTGALIIKDSYLTGMYHGILLERQLGAATIDNNTLDALYTGTLSGTKYGGRAIEAINYGSTDVTSLQKISNNSFVNFKSTGIQFTGGFSGQTPRKFTNVLIENNNFNFSSTDISNLNGAIYLANISTSNSNPDGGVSAEINNNYIHVPSGNGVRVNGLNGEISLSRNSIVDNFAYGVKADESQGATINAENNWWGNSAPNFATIVSGNVDYTPWYINSGMTILSSSVSGDTITSTTGVDVSLGSGGQADLPTGVTNLIFGNNSNLDLHGGLVGNAVTIQSGVDGTPIVMTEVGLPGVSASIPDGTTIQGPSGWDGIIIPPTLGTPSGDAPAGFSVGGVVISVGSTSGTLTFDKPVTLLLAGVAGTVGYKPAGSTTWTEINNACGGDYANPVFVSNECSISNGTDTKILTNHFTDFGELDYVTAPTVPALVGPTSGAFVKPAGLILDWSDSVDSEGSAPVKYYYQSSYSSAVGSSNSLASPLYTSGLLSDSQIDASGTGDGTYYWQVRACDSLSNCSNWSGPWQINVDNTAPTVNLVFPTPGPSATSFQAVFSEDVNSAEATDPANYFLQNWPGAGGSGNLSGHATVSYNASSRTATVTFTTAGWSISPEQEWGVQNIHDLAGNLQAVSPYSEISTPMVAPTDPGTPVSTPNPTNVFTQAWTWLTSTDTGGSGVKGYYQSVYNVVTHINSAWSWIGNVLSVSTNLNDGQYQLQLKAEDNAGNQSGVSSSATLTVDSVAPVITINPYTTTFTNQDVTVTASTSEGTLNVASHTFTSNGAFDFIATDVAGNSKTETVTITNIDKATPVAVITAPVTSASVSGTVAIRGTVTEEHPHHYWLAIYKKSNGQQIYSSTVNHSDEFNNRLLYSWDTIGKADGVYQIKFAEKDAANNRSADFITEVTVDNTAPIITGTPSDIIAEATSASGAVVSYANPTANDAVAGVLTVSCAPLSGSTFPLAVTTVTCSATDLASNTATTTFNVTVRDTTAPSVPTQVSPTDGVYLTSTNFTKADWDGVSDLSTPISYFYQSSNSNSTNSDGSFMSPVYTSVVLSASEIPTLGTSEGIYYWHVRAVDAAGNSSAWSGAWKVTVDNTLPASEITAPSNEGDNDIIYRNNWDGSISGTATDALSGVAGVKISIQKSSDSTYWDGSIWQADETTVDTTVTGVGNASATWTYGLISPAQDTYTIKSHAMDEAGNMENTYTLTIIFDKTIPEVNLTIDPSSPNGDNSWYDSVPTITLTASDSNLDKIEYQIDSKTGAWTTYANPVTIDDGVHVFYYRSLDLAGNYSDIGVKNVKVDTRNPDNITNLDTKYDGDNNSVKLSWKVSDSDIANVFVYRGKSKDFKVNMDSRVAKNDTNDRSYTDDKVSLGEKYYYKIVTIDDAGNKSDTKIISVKIPQAGGIVIVTNEGTEATPQEAVLGTQSGNDGTQGGQNPEVSTGGDGQIAGDATTKNTPQSGNRNWLYWTFGILALVMGAWWLKVRRGSRSIM